eukprot:TRINITY_DN343_c0_g2_i4.p1 TRINITY_DN343_c0_g2~~TRINITY_DN343_c0_g2_i4.p1  ORF type:complete len:1713 (-),score=401.63 TRINITY_DN343_c0_g2_i4:3715-8853(-)
MTTFDLGTFVWVASESDAWVPGKVIGNGPSGLNVTLDDGKEVTIEASKLKDVQAIHPSCLEGIEDMVQLADLHEAGLLHTLRKRFQENKIYTYTGAILVSMNPYQPLDLYTNEILHSYRGKPLGSMPPHIFAVADNAYRNMCENKADQAVVISGESGAGKTEATKLILQYLAAASGHHSWVEQQILDSSPILEAFGNAKTIRNDNSSRFGKFIEVHFDAENKICGASITNYLLEKSRIVQQAPDERNYHIFYQLTAGATEEERETYHIRDAREYRYLNQSGCYSIDHVDDKEDFNRVKMALSVLNFTDEEIDAIFRILSGILHIGNVTFKASADGESCTIENLEAVKIAANVLRTSPELLQSALVNRTNVIAGSAIVVPFKAKEAAEARDAFSKTIYGRMFDWIVMRINDSIRQGKKQCMIGVLDIFGFEIFEHNSFEQFCINLANEKLQQHFNQFIFKSEQEEYTKEKIDWSAITFVDNQECLDLVEKKPLGLIYLIDEMCKAPKGSDQMMLEKFNKNHEKCPFYEKQKIGNNRFAIKHYAGPVVYEVDGFMDKNKDPLYFDYVEAMQNSQAEHIVALFPEDNPKDANKAKDKKKAAPTAKQTVAFYFKDQLTALMSTLNATQPHFVRCLKPNFQKKPRIFDSQFALRQLRYAGMMEAVRIRRLGYPVRRLPLEFSQRYRVLSPSAAGTTYADKCKSILSAVNLPAASWQLGATKVFLRDATYQQLEKMRIDKIKESVVRVQNIWRAYKDRKKFKAVRRAAKLIQPIVRGHLGRLKFRKIWRARDQQLSAAETKAMEMEDRFCKKIWAEKTKVERERKERETRRMGQEETYTRQVYAAILMREIQRQNDELKKMRQEEIYQSHVYAAIKRKILEEKQKQAIQDAELEKAKREAEHAAAVVAAAQRAAHEAAEKEAKALVQAQKDKEAKEKAAKEREALEKQKREKEEKDKLEREKFARRKVSVVHVSIPQQPADEFDDLDQLLSQLEGEKADLETKISEVGKIDIPLTVTATPAVARVKPVVGNYLRVVFEYSAVDQSQMSLSIGELIQVLQVDDSGWCRGVGRNKTGWFPTDFVEIVDEATARQMMAPASAAAQAAAQAGPARPVKAVRVSDSAPASNLSKVVTDNTSYFANIESGATVKAICDYTAGDSTQLSFKKDDIIKVIENDESGWCQGELNGSVGWFPYEHVEFVSGKDLGDQKKTRLRAGTRIDDPNIIVESSVPVNVPRDINRYQMDEFGRRNFSQHKTGTFRKRTLDATDMLIHTKEPLKATMMRIEEPEIVEVALEIFLCIMKYMGDHPSKKDDVELVQYIVKNGLSVEVLRDEIYIQIFKQMCQNPSMESSLAGWELFGHCVGAFPPSKSLELYLVNFFKHFARMQGQIGDLASYCLKSLPRVMLNGCRKFPPTLKEVDCMKRNVPNVIYVKLLDGTSKVIGIESQTTVKEAIAHVCKKMQLKNAALFGLYEVSNGQERLMRSDDLVIDYVANWDHTKVLDGSFLFKMRVFMPSLDTGKDEALSIMIYNYVHSFVVDESYPCTEEEAITLAALQGVIETGTKHAPLGTVIGTNLHRFLPSKMALAKPATAWVKIIGDRIQVLPAQQKIVRNAREAYLAVCRQWSFYGLHCFNVDQTVAVGNIPSKFSLSVNTEGFQFLDLKTKALLQKYRFSEVSNWNFSSNNFVIVVGDLRKQSKFMLKSKQASEIASLVQTYVSLTS